MSEEAVENVIVNIHKKLDSWSSAPSNPSIFRVGDHLRSINPEAYDPEIIAIGPFHRNKPQLQKMEKHKVRYLKLLLQRIDESSVERYVIALRDFENKARECYAEDIELNRDEFIEMLLLDGCFIVEFLWKFQHNEGTDGDPIFQYGHIQNHLMRDLMLFENQIPFFVIECLFKMFNTDSQYRDIRSIIWPLLQNGIIPVKDLPPQVPESPHLLGIVHDIQCSSFANMSCQIYTANGTSGDINSATNVLPQIDTADGANRNINSATNVLPTVNMENGINGNINSATDALPQIETANGTNVNTNSADVLPPTTENGTNGNINSALDVLTQTDTANGTNGNTNPAIDVLPPIDVENGTNENTNSATERPIDNANGTDWNIYSATELKELGISFKKSADNTLFHIEFKNKAMSIPVWEISDTTESSFRNLMAYEYYQTNSPKKYVTDYVLFMKCLVHSPEDAKLLRRYGIISNLFGGDEMVYQLINQLGKNIIISEEFSYSDVVDKVNCHCHRRSNRWMARLRRDYFNSPWALLSVLAAIAVLVLAITQTTFAILSYCNDLKKNERS